MSAWFGRTNTSGSALPEGDDPKVEGEAAASVKVEEEHDVDVAAVGDDYEDFYDNGDDDGDEDETDSPSLDAGSTPVRAPLSEAVPVPVAGSYGSTGSGYTSALEHYASMSAGSFGSAVATPRGSVLSADNGVPPEVDAPGTAVKHPILEVRAPPTTEDADFEETVGGDEEEVDEDDDVEGDVEDFEAEADDGEEDEEDGEEEDDVEDEEVLTNGVEKAEDELPETAAGMRVSSAEFVSGEVPAISAAVLEDEDDGEDDGEWEENDEDDEDDDDEQGGSVPQELLQQLLARSRAAEAAGGAPLLRVNEAADSTRPSLEPAPRAGAPRAARAGLAAGAAAGTVAAADGGAGAEAEEDPTGPEAATRQKLQSIRVKLLRLAHRLGQSPHNVVVAQVLYRLRLAEELHAGRIPSRATNPFQLGAASALAEEQESGAADSDLDFTCTIMLLGKSGVGKSATINSIFDEVEGTPTQTTTYISATKKVTEIVGKVHGIRVRIIDTPGLLPSASEQRHNEKVMGKVKRFIKGRTPDIVLYFDRLDMFSRDYGDLPLLRTITDTFGAAVWFNAIVVLTHAATAPPEGPNGQLIQYEMYVAQRSHAVQQMIRQATSDLRLMNPVSLVENHPQCRTNRTGQRVLPNGQVWKPQLLLLCFASKILAEANSLLKLPDSNGPGARPFGAQRSRAPPLPVLLSQLLQPRQPLRMPDEATGEDEDEDDFDDDDLDDDEEDAFDKLPPFRQLTSEEQKGLSSVQRREYLEEIAERERLFMKKQWREELRRRRETRRRAQEKGGKGAGGPGGGGAGAGAGGRASADDMYAEGEDEDDLNKPNQVPVPMPDMALPPTFDSDNPTYRYRYLEAPNQWLIRPMLEAHGWDHDSGYDAFSVEKSAVVMGRFPAMVSGQVSKDKRDANVTLEAMATARHSEGKVTTAGLDVQTVGKDLAVTVRSETRINTFRRNKTTGGASLTLLGDTVAGGLKVENRLALSRTVRLTGSGAVIMGRQDGRQDAAYGGSAELSLRGKDFPIDRRQATLGASIMDWHSDLAIGANLQVQLPVGKTMLVSRANLNNRGAGSITIRASSNEQLLMALLGVVPMLRYLWSGRGLAMEQ